MHRLSVSGLGTDTYDYDGGWQALNLRSKFGCRMLRFLKRAGFDFSD